MISDELKLIANRIRRLQDEASEIRIPDRVIEIRDSGHILDPTIVAQGRWYLRPIAQQINTCYDHSCFDACLVLMRRLVETLIIEVFVAKNRENEILDANAFYYPFSTLIDTAIKKGIGLSKNSKRFLPNIKNLGDSSAHNRMFIARRSDIENMRVNFRILVEELYHLST